MSLLLEMFTYPFILRAFVVGILISLCAALLGVLACDPRPGYEDKPQEIYGLAFAGLDVGFQVQGEVLRVVRVNHQKGE